jgi:hypothetical protein
LYQARLAICGRFQQQRGALIGLERRDLAMAFGDWGRYANRTNLLSQCERFLVSREEASRIVDDMVKIVDSTWYAIARQAGVSERDCELIRSAFVYEGFGYDLTGSEYCHRRCRRIAVRSCANVKDGAPAIPIEERRRLVDFRLGQFSDRSYLSAKSIT